ncbi:hypothetical protein PMZ80_006376 [Knufia obscura]|uniref:Uncharacterized protein n=1 Tax=Knufia obscura TaxID=1635080 RepID=A0ABR0RKH2_9EURO|nr:hypothetical protein PMZ80_006376 [Knufia obscura]
MSIQDSRIAMLARTILRGAQRNTARLPRARIASPTPQQTRQFHGRDFKLDKWPGLANTLLISTPLIAATGAAILYENMCAIGLQPRKEEGEANDGADQGVSASRIESEVKSWMLETRYGWLMWSPAQKPAVVETKVQTKNMGLTGTKEIQGARSE